MTSSKMVPPRDVGWRVRVAGIATFVLAAGLLLMGWAGPHFHGGGGSAHHLTTTFVGLVAAPAGLLVAIKGVTRQRGWSGPRAVWVLLGICIAVWVVRVVVPPWYWT